MKSIVARRGRMDAEPTDISRTPSSLTNKLLFLLIECHAWVVQRVMSDV